MTQAVAQQAVLPGGRTSVTATPGTSPGAAVAAARAAQGFEKAPSAIKGAGGKGGSGGGGVPEEEYEEDLAPIDAGPDIDIGGDEEEERTDGKRQDKNGRWRDEKGHFTTPPDEPMPRSVDAFNGVLVPKPNTGAERLVKLWRDAFSRDQHPDVPLAGAVPRREQSARDLYISESERLAQTIQAGGRLRAPDGRFAKGVRVTAHGAVEYVSSKGRVLGVARTPYRGEGGRFTPNINAPEAKDPAELRRVVDARLRRYGEAFFGDRAGFTERRLMLMRYAFILDREQRAWPVPDWRAA